MCVLLRLLGRDQPSARVGGWKLLPRQVLRQSDADGDGQQAGEAGEPHPVHRHVFWKVSNRSYLRLSSVWSKWLSSTADSSCVLLWVVSLPEPCSLETSTSTRPCLACCRSGWILEPKCASVRKVGVKHTQGNETLPDTCMSIYFTFLSC